MQQQKMVDHLFRHQYGKMVSILTRIFGLKHLETIEDAVQDTFVTALRTWQNGLPENPEAWLTAAAKNRALDLFRKLSAEQARIPKLDNGPSAIALNELFLESEIADSQLRMIFAACHPELKPQDQIAFALKTISGFSQKEIAASLLLKEETVKKRLVRARKNIIESQLQFEFPAGTDLVPRHNRVLEVLYLIFNEGFHSTQQAFLVREDLCAEAMRLCKMLLQNEHTRTPSTHALFALMCFNLARLNSKIDHNQQVVSLKHQDRSLWDNQLIQVGHFHMSLAVETNTLTAYHYEAAISAEHASAKTWQQTNWPNILHWYEQLNVVQPSPLIALNRAVIYVELKEFETAKVILESVSVSELEQREYLYHGLWAEYHHKKGDKQKALLAIDKALALVTNQAERVYLEGKKAKYTT
ncbi:MAG: sigma-70 family RNA polymerase sigma factor [Bacteroidetes bacterium]|nr:sigma-70 family RNA polymerase sigma factor [Bacteroidota bacterium]